MATTFSIVLLALFPLEGFVVTFAGDYDSWEASVRDFLAKGSSSSSGVPLTLTLRKRPAES